MTENEFLNDEPRDESGRFKSGQSGNPKGRPKGTQTSRAITEEDRKFYGTDPRLFFERGLARATTFEEGLKYARELRMLQYPPPTQTQTNNYHTITLAWDFGSATNQVDNKATKEKVLEYVGQAIQKQETSKAKED
ncbi:MAG: hypothetical protein C0446_08275 [Chitinophaga sp.]|nr:hypothetical protein [Chitinophaga sp.]